MSNKIKVLFNNRDTEISIIRFFKKNNQVYLVYSLSEKDENEYIKLYVSKIFNQAGQLVGNGITEENEWNDVKKDIQDIIRANRENLQPNIIDIDVAILKNVKIIDKRAFKLLEQSINLLVKKTVIRKDTDNYEELYLKEQQNNMILINKINDFKDSFGELSSKLDDVIKFIENN
ncbi:MAG: hypothetical protein RR847_04340 [Bacilli bacterium]